MTTATLPRAHTERPVTDLPARFDAVRAATRALAAPLSAEDALLQSMPDASPSKWHLAHTTWFFEQFILAELPGFSAFDPAYDFLFNSYYESVGPRHARPQRGVLSRPGLERVLEYRDSVEERMRGHFARGALPDELARRLELGLHHEQQHQELLLTDIKHAFSLNPLEPAYRARPQAAPASRNTGEREWCEGAQGSVRVGASAWPSAAVFAFDHESPPHLSQLAPHALARHPVDNAAYRDFVGEGAYANPLLWLSAGWDWICANDIARPIYWGEDLESEFTLQGRRALDPAAPVVHLNYFEADAFARWAGARLPTEIEWESAAAALAVAGNFADSGLLHPASSPVTNSAAAPLQMFGDVWEWTASAYLPYPGYRPLEGALGEYNGKFMCGQFVLRGGSCASPGSHLRASYRNFFMPADRWQFSGIRLARDL